MGRAALSHSLVLAPTLSAGWGRRERDQCPTDPVGAPETRGRTARTAGSADLRLTWPACLSSPHPNSSHLSVCTGSAPHVAPSLAGEHQLLGCPALPPLGPCLWVASGKSQESDACLCAPALGSTSCLTAATPPAPCPKPPEQPLPARHYIVKGKNTCFFFASWSFSSSSSSQARGCRRET